MHRKNDKKYYIGASKPGKWASIYGYKPRNEHFLEEKGEVFAAISLEGPTGFNAPTAGNFLLDHLHESYFEGDSTSPLLCLENAVISTAKKLAEIVDNDQNIGDAGINLDIASISIVGDLIYFVKMGSGGIYIYRDEKLIDIDTALKDPTGNGYIRSASSTIQKGDVILLITRQGIEAFTADELLQSTATFNEKDLKSKPLADESLLSLVLIGVDLDIKEEVEPVIDESIVAHGSQLKEIEKSMEENEQEMMEEVEDESIEPTWQSDEIVKKPISEAQEEMEEHGLRVPRSAVREGRSDMLGKLRNSLLGVQKNIKNSKVLDNLKGKIDSMKPEGSEDSTFMFITKTIGEKVKSAYAVVKQKFWMEFLQMDQGLYLKDARRGTNWRLVGTLAVVAIVGLFFVSKIYGNYSENNRINNNIQNVLLTTQEYISTNDPLIRSTAGSIDPDGSEKFTYQQQISDNLAELQSIEQYNRRTDEINNLKTKLVELDDLLNRRIQINDPKILADLVLEMGEGVNISDIEVRNSKVFISDAGRGVIYSVNADGSDLKELVKGLKSPKSLSITGDGKLIGIDEDGVEPFFTFNPDSGEIRRFAGIVGSNLNSVVDIEAFDLSGIDRVYYLKTEGPPVQYISEVGAGFAGAYAKFNDASFARATDIEIDDGKVYLLFPGEGAARYLGDQKEDFSILGLTSEELTQIANAGSFDVVGSYIVYGNSQGRSIVFTSKSRESDITISDYVSQFKFKEGVGINIKEVVVDMTNKDIFVLDGSKIIKVDFEQVSYIR